ncbi:MAG: hypothetical protein L0Z62_31665 [Gemmataceae bacterium]|nr:hypothetical protein [Gemmataceae bacterium]
MTRTHWLAAWAAVLLLGSAAQAQRCRPSTPEPTSCGHGEVVTPPCASPLDCPPAGACQTTQGPRTPYYWELPQILYPPQALCPSSNPAMWAQLFEAMSRCRGDDSEDCDQGTAAQADPRERARHRSHQGRMASELLKLYRLFYHHGHYNAAAIVAERALRLDPTNVAAEQAAAMARLAVSSGVKAGCGMCLSVTVKKAEKKSCACGSKCGCAKGNCGCGEGCSCAKKACACAKAAKSCGCDGNCACKATCECAAACGCKQGCSCEGCGCKKHPTVRADVEEFLYAMLREDGFIRHPGLAYEVIVKRVQGRKLIDAEFKRRDLKTGQLEQTVRAREAELQVTAEGKQLQVRMRHGFVAPSNSDNGPAFFKERVWSVDLPPDCVQQMNRHRPGVARAACACGKGCSCCKECACGADCPCSKASRQNVLRIRRLTRPVMVHPVPPPAMPVPPPPPINLPMPQVMTPPMPGWVPVCPAPMPGQPWCMPVPPGACPHLPMPTERVQAPHLVNAPVMEQARAAVLPAGVRMHSTPGGQHVHIASLHLDACCESITSLGDGRFLLEGDVVVNLHVPGQPAKIQAARMIVNPADGSYEVNPRQTLPQVLKQILHRDCVPGSGE